MSPETVGGLGARLRRGETTPAELAAQARGALQSIEDLHPVLRYTDALTERQAGRAARMLAESPERAGPLCGIPFAYKDVLLSLIHIYLGRGRGDG